MLFQFNNRPETPSEKSRNSSSLVVTQGYLLIYLQFFGIRSIVLRFFEPLMLPNFSKMRKNRPLSHQGKNTSDFSRFPIPSSSHKDNPSQLGQYFRKAFFFSLSPPCALLSSMCVSFLLDSITKGWARASKQRGRISKCQPIAKNNGAKGVTRRRIYLGQLSGGLAST